MPIGWLTVLQTVPWGEVISNAPKVADGAKKLWNAVAKKPRPDSAPVAEALPALSEEARAIAALQAQLAAVEAAAADLHEQMLASSELIQALADQNSQLIQRVEAHRVKVVWLAAATGLLAFLTAGSLAGLLLR
jgi:hypothetical protein